MLNKNENQVYEMTKQKLIRIRLETLNQPFLGRKIVKKSKVSFSRPRVTSKEFFVRRKKLTLAFLKSLSVSPPHSSRLGSYISWLKLFFSDILWRNGGRAFLAKQLPLAKLPPVRKCWPIKVSKTRSCLAVWLMQKRWFFCSRWRKNQRYSFYWSSSLVSFCILFSFGMWPIKMFMLPIYHSIVWCFAPAPPHVLLLMHQTSF